MTQTAVLRLATGAVIAERKFENEQGRPVTIECLAKAGDVSIAITGPQTRATNLITRREAENLSVALDVALGFDGEALLRAVVDAAWGHAFENESVPANEVATKIIDKARAMIAGGYSGGNPLPDYVVDRLKAGDRVLVEVIVGARRFNGGWPVQLLLDDGESCTIDSSGIVHASALRAVVERAR